MTLASDGADSGFTDGGWGGGCFVEGGGVSAAGEGGSVAVAGPGDFVAIKLGFALTPNTWAYHTTPHHTLTIFNCKPT